MSIQVKLIRTATSNKGTYGELKVNEVPLCNTLELPWRDNQENISCIPMGKYKVKRHRSPSQGDVFWIQNVKDRTYIYLHIGNWIHEIKGCILVGSGHLDDGSGLADSARAMNKLFRKLPDEFELEIFNALF